MLSEYPSFQLESPLGCDKVSWYEFAQLVTKEARLVHGWVMVTIVDLKSSIKQATI